METDAKQYATPQVTDYGDLVELTAAASSGGETDAAFPIHTPFTSLTFTTHP
jgi:hypothetical protein